MARSVEKEIKIIEADIAKKIDESYPQPQESETPIAKYRRMVNQFYNGTRVQKDKILANSEKFSYLIKLGWQCGKSSTETMNELGIHTTGNNASYKAFVAIRQAIKAQVVEWDACDIYQKFCERARGIIRNLEFQASLIEKAWRDEERRASEDPEYIIKQPYAREHIVLWDMIFKMETKIIEIGIEMNVIGKKGDDKTINFVTSTSLLPDARGEDASYQSLPESPAVKMVEDMKQRAKMAEVSMKNQPQKIEAFREAAREAKARSMFGDDE